MHIKGIELIRRNNAIAILLDLNCIHDMKFMHAGGKCLDVDFEDFPFQSMLSVSWISFRLESDGILSSYHGDMLDFLTHPADIRSIRFIADDGKTAMFTLPWLGKNGDKNEALKIRRDPDSPEDIIFEAGFLIQ